MKLRVKKRWRTPQNIANMPHASDTLPAEHTASAQQTACTEPAARAQCPKHANPRALGNPYGRLFTNDRKFSDLLTKNFDCQANKACHTQSAAAADDRTANTVLTAPEKQAK